MPANSMSSSCARVTGARPALMRRVPSHQTEAKASRYMTPYQRTASGPIENTIGSKFGCVNMLARLARYAPRVQHELARGDSLGAAAPGQPQVEARMGVGDLAVGDAAPPEVGHRSRHHGDAEAARDQAHDGLHLDRLLRHTRCEAGTRRE